MIKNQNQPIPESGPDDSQPVHIQQGSEILRLILAYEKLVHKGNSRTEAANTLSRQNRGFRPDFFEALVTLDPNAEEGGIRRCRIEDLRAGMIIQQDVRTVDNTLLVSKGQEVTAPLLIKLKNLHERRSISADVTVSMPKSTLTFVKGA